MVEPPCSGGWEPVLSFEATVAGRVLPLGGSRWHGVLVVEAEPWRRILLLMTGSIASWIQRGEKVRVESKVEPKKTLGGFMLDHCDYRLVRLTSWGEVVVWPPWVKEYRVEKPYYKGVIRAREAVTVEDYEAIASLEQYHYASKEELVAVWKCPRDGTLVEANTRPKCPKCGADMLIQEIRGSLPSSRFMVLELASRRSYEPRVVGYVRVDTPIPLMHRRVPDPETGGYRVERLVRERFFPRDWFHPTFWPISPRARRRILRMFRELAPIYGRSLARTMVGHRIASEALARANTAAARIARVVVHPDYRGGGLGVLAVRAALEWVAERRVPEMRRPKHVVETIAAMARYNPFFERAGFYYMWDTASGRPVLMYPLSEEARRRIMEYLERDPVGRSHGGRLYRPRYKPTPSLEGPIRLVGVSKSYRSELGLEGLPEEVAEALRAFGVERRVVERQVLRDVTLEIRPGEIVVVVGASGAGKTTLLRLILGATGRFQGVPGYMPDEGRVEVPGNAVVAALLPGEVEPEFGGGSLLEEVTRLTGDVVESLEVLSAAGISDAVLYRARFEELSTGQKERAKIAMLLASKPNLLVIDEFTAHLDPVTAAWVAGRVARISRKHGMTVVVATHRREVITSMRPDRVLVVGYGRVVEAGPGEASL